MHELGIVFYIIRDVKKAAAEHGVDRVSAVVMDIGEVSTIVPEYLTDCWRWAADKEDLLRGSELKINIIPAVTWCDDCKQEYGTVAHGKTCPHCGSENTWLLRGREVEIREIEVPDNANTQSSTIT
jgi:hydrogenase nickel incorporation protein HypA/HybF